MLTSRITHVSHWQAHLHWQSPNKLVTSGELPLAALRVRTNFSARNLARGGSVPVLYPGYFLHPGSQCLLRAAHCMLPHAGRIPDRDFSCDRKAVELARRIKFPRSDIQPVYLGFRLISAKILVQRQFGALLTCHL